MSENRNPPTAIILIILLLISYKTFSPMLFDKSIYRADGFSVKKPVDWEMKKDKSEVTFIAPEKDVFSDAPVAIFAIYSEKQKGALFMDDLFPELIAAMRKENGKVLGTGEELIDGQRARWILFRYNNPEIAVISLYLADEYNRLTRIQFVGSQKKFKEYGKEFDKFKKSIKLKKAIAG